MANSRRHYHDHETLVAVVTSPASAPSLLLLFRGRNKTKWGTMKEEEKEERKRQLIGHFCFPPANDETDKKTSEKRASVFIWVVLNTQLNSVEVTSPFYLWTAKIGERSAFISNSIRLFAFSFSLFLKRKGVKFRSRFRDQISFSFWPFLQGEKEESKTWHYGKEKTGWAEEDEAC